MISNKYVRNGLASVFFIYTFFATYFGTIYLFHKIGIHVSPHVDYLWFVVVLLSILIIYVSYLGYLRLIRGHSAVDSDVLLYSLNKRFNLIEKLDDIYETNEDDDDAYNLKNDLFNIINSLDMGYKKIRQQDKNRYGLWMYDM